MTELRQRAPRVEDPDFLAFVRTQRCCRCGAPPKSQAMHIRGASAAHGKRETGKGEKPDDRWALPGCSSCHLDAPDALHRVGEGRFFAAAGIDAFAAAIDLYARFQATMPRSKPRGTPRLPARAKSRTPIAVNRTRRSRIRRHSGAS